MKRSFSEHQANNSILEIAQIWETHLSRSSITEESNTGKAVNGRHQGGTLRPTPGSHAGPRFPIQQPLAAQTSFQAVDAKLTGTRIPYRHLRNFGV